MKTQKLTAESNSSLGHLSQRHICLAVRQGLLLDRDPFSPWLPNYRTLSFPKTSPIKSLIDLSMQLREVQNCSTI